MANSKRIEFDSDRNAWVWGFTPQAELWNGRLAMVGFVFTFLAEVLFS